MRNITDINFWTISIGNNSLAQIRADNTALTMALVSTALALSVIECSGGTEGAVGGRPMARFNWIRQSNAIKAYFFATNERENQNQKESRSEVRKIES